MVPDELVVDGLFCFHADLLDKPESVAGVLPSPARYTRLRFWTHATAEVARFFCHTQSRDPAMRRSEYCGIPI